MNIYLPYGTSPARIEEVRRAIENTGHSVNWIGTLVDPDRDWCVERWGIDDDEGIVLDTIESILEEDNFQERYQWLLLTLRVTHKELGRLAKRVAWESDPAKRDLLRQQERDLAPRVQKLHQAFEQLKLANRAGPKP